MGTFKDVYDILKDLRNLAKEASNQEMIDLAVQIQDKIFDLKNDNQILKDENKKLQQIIDNLENAKEIEKHIIPMQEPIFQLDNDTQKSFYCQHCWEKEKKLYKVTTFYWNYEPKFKCYNCNNEGYTKCEIQ